MKYMIFGGLVVASILVSITLSFVHAVGEYEGSEWFHE